MCVYSWLTLWYAGTNTTLQRNYISIWKKTIIVSGVWVMVGWGEGRSVSREEVWNQEWVDWNHATLPSSPLLISSVFWCLLLVLLWPAPSSGCSRSPHLLRWGGSIPTLGYLVTSSLPPFLLLCICVLHLYSFLIHQSLLPISICFLHIRS